MKRSSSYLAIRLSLAGIFFAEILCAAAKEFTLETARDAAAKGNAQAEFYLAKHYADGIGITQNYSMAVEYLRQSAGQGYAPAETGLAACYAHGLGVPQDYTKAVQWYRRAANQGDALAEYSLGCAYAEGKGVETNSDSAASWWRKSAEQGQVYAQNELGLFYLRRATSTNTNHSDFAVAVKWLAKAAGQGYAPAMATLGHLYQYGIGVRQDWQQAIKWNGRAAEQGIAAAEDDLGLMYEDGDGGLPRDKVQAYKWFLLSKAQGNAMGLHDAMEFETRHILTPDEINRARQMAEAFHPKSSTNPLRAVEN